MTKAGFLKSGFGQQGQLWRIALGMVLAMPPLFFDIAGLSVDGERMLAVAILMAAWWALEAMALAVTALAPLLLMPSLNILPMRDTAGSYAHPILFLLFGGFTLALVIEKCGLHMRAAYKLLSMLGVHARDLIAGLMVIAAFLSMWISNTSTTIMLLPVAISITVMVRQHFSNLPAQQLGNFEAAVFLGLAYGATLGGISTMIGTAPNAYAVGFIQSTYGVEVSFLDWMRFGVPLMLIMVPLAWAVLTFLLYPVDFRMTDEIRGIMRRDLTALGPVSTTEKRVMMVFLATVLAWMSRPYIVGTFGISGISDTTISIAAVFLLFTVPAGDRDGALLEWDDMAKLPWGVLLLFGGGFALAAGITASGLSAWIGGQLAPLSGMPLLVILFAIAAVLIFLTEITSNTATITTFLPIIAALAVSLGQPPLQLIVPVALAASFAFMFPVATPPNAIIFGTGRIKMQQMIRAGLVLNVFGVFVLGLFAYYILPLTLDLSVTP
jgi:sodium-dependent dicarboxylate transporter 2/3/5